MNAIRQRVGATASNPLGTAFRNGGANAASFFTDRTWGYNATVTVGWPSLDRFGAWQFTAGYKYVQRDAVLDAFTDSDFHLGGTDAQGYTIGALMGLTKGSWLRARWMSSDAIDGSPLGIDILQFDLNAKF